ncbi:F-box/SPRY domain-containing protein 1 [Branchiostoma belcheri]|nr:F-box/SPRY domain-containing protein 1 [Branchiostoma belcheri]
MAAAKLPCRVLDVIFGCLDLPDLANCALVCKHWCQYLSDDNSDVWRLQCVRKVADEALKSDILCNVTSYKAKAMAFCHAWNPQDCSRNIYIKPNGFTLHRNPVAQSTDGVRGKIGFNSGRHAWEVCDDQSWGWNLVDNHLLHNGDSQGNFPQCNNAPKYQPGYHPDFCSATLKIFPDGTQATVVQNIGNLAESGSEEPLQPKPTLIPIDWTPG